nr:alpha amylase N-terminal ig-like domain-containing protein [Lachnospiraceae bacterium]
MNKYALLHIMDSAYCFPVSPNEIVLRLRTAKNDLQEASVVYESKYVIGDRQKSAKMRRAYSDGLFDYFEVKLKLDDTRLGYVFLLDDGKEKLYFCEDGAIKDYDFSHGYYNFFQYPFINPVDIVRVVPWMKTATFYQIFVDRFCRGNEEKDDSYINLKWGSKPNPKSFAGGDLKGITKKLSYLKDCGIDSVYLTPVFTSVSNHK